MTYKLNTVTGVIRVSDGAAIPADPANTDYAAYLAWVAEGNAPEPADQPNPNIAILAQIAAIESATMVPRVIREFMLRAAEKDAAATGIDLTTDIAYQRVKSVNDEIRALRGQLK